MHASATVSDTAEAIQQKVEIEEEGVKFSLSRFTDGRSTPYRISFRDEHLGGSSYRLSAEGHVEYFKAGSEVYYDRMEMDDESLTYLMKTKTRERSTTVSHSEEDLPASGCAECTLAWEAVCGTGLPMFCNKVQRPSLGDDGAESVEILCGRQEGACTTVKGLCDHVCAAEEEPSESFLRHDAGSVFRFSLKYGSVVRVRLASVTRPWVLSRTSVFGREVWCGGIRKASLCERVHCNGRHMSRDVCASLCWDLATMMSRMQKLCSDRTDPTGSKPSR